MRLRLLGLCLLLVACGDAVDPLDATIAAEMEEGGIPGLAAVAFVDGEVVWEGYYGFADIEAGRRVDEVPDNVFATSSRINSTWGGNLTDMVRARRILEVVEDRDLITNAKVTGEHLLTRLQEIGERHAAVTNVRGRGLLCAVDLPTGAARDAVSGAGGLA